MPAKPAAGFDPAGALLAAFATCQRINQYTIENLSDEAWTAPPTGGKGRNVGSLFAHIHNVRLMWLKSLGVAAMPEKLEGDNLTKAQVSAALNESFEALSAVVSAAIRSDGRIKGFRPDAASFIAYMIAHDSHHRGQAAMLARQSGHPLSKSAGFGMWEWGSR